MKILIVEDEVRIANTLKKGLSEEKHVVDVVYDGLDGYDMALEEHYDVIILDLMLPTMDGIEICKALRKAKITTPVLMLTAKSQIKDKVIGLDVGADDYLTKPFAFDELLARLRALKRRGTNKLLKDSLVVSDLLLDTKSLEVTRGDQKIILSHKEFSLLEYLMRNKNKILRKQQIISEAWDFDADILPNTLEVHIKNLRSKIDTPFKDKKSLIHTIYGFGYKMGE